MSAWLLFATAAIAFRPRPSRTRSWLYLRFTLSYRDVEELLAERGLDPIDERYHMYRQLTVTEDDRFPPDRAIPETAPITVPFVERAFPLFLTRRRDLLPSPCDKEGFQFLIQSLAFGSRLSSHQHDLLVSWRRIEGDI
jgi:hypothetical protein